MSTQCIICLREHIDQTVEHIIPSSLGNEYYVLPKGKVCHQCNNRFAKVENKVVSSNVFLRERIRLGLQSNNSSSTGELYNIHLIYVMVKMGYEGLYKSRKKVWDLYEWEDIRIHLNQRKSLEVLNDRNLPKNIEFKSIPNWIDRFRLRNNHLSLEYGVFDKGLFIRFQFGRISSWARLQ